MVVWHPGFAWHILPAGIFAMPDCRSASREYTKGLKFSRLGHMLPAGIFAMTEGRFAPREHTKGLQISELGKLNTLR